MEQKITLGAGIRTLREARGMSMKELAAATDLPYYTIANIELGLIKQPKIHSIKKIAEAIQVDHIELLKLM